jgi:excisionase family DNA binding protein
MFEMIPIDDDSHAGQPLMRPSDLMQRLGVSRSWLYQAAKDGRIPSVRLGGPDGPLRFHAADIDAWLDRAREGWQPNDTAATTLRRAAGTRRSACQLSLTDQSA